MFDTLPSNTAEVRTWTWDHYKPYFDDLLNRELSAQTVEAWLDDWTHVASVLSEVNARLNVAITVNTADEESKKLYFNFLEHIQVPAQAANNQLNLKLLESGLEPAGFAIPLRGIRVQAEIFRDENLMIQVEEEKLSTQYDEIHGAQTVTWDGKDLTLAQLAPIFKGLKRDQREQMWRAMVARRVQDREALNTLWTKLYANRKQQATVAGFANFRDLRWKQFERFDYTPDDCISFHNAIEQVVVPAATRIYERQRQMMGVDTLRPWDVTIDIAHPNEIQLDPSGRAPLAPFEGVSELERKTARIFDQVDPELGHYYDIMLEERLLDLGNRKNKAPGAYCTAFALAQRPYIFMNAVGMHDDVQTLLHEAGHAFHAFESMNQRFYQQSGAPIEFCEVASMSMELLAGPYLLEAQGGFYNEPNAARARAEHLESMITFWPYMATIDAFQHWAYTHEDEGMTPAACDAKWAELFKRFLPAIDWSGLDDAVQTGWQHKLHVFNIPFYYVEYGLAQLGAAQVWANSLKDPVKALADYKHALSLGNTVSLPELFAAAGARFAFDADTLHTAVDLIENTLNALNTVA